MSNSTEHGRRNAIEQALASGRLEGFEPDEEYLSLLERYISGELTADDVRRRLDEADAQNTAST